MTSYALVDNGEVREVVEAPPGTPVLKQRFHPDVLAKFVAIPPPLEQRVAPGWLWDGNNFAAPSPPPLGPVYVPAGVLRERMEAAGKWDQMASLLVALMSTQPGLVLKLLTLTEGVATDDQQARALIAQAGADPDVILSA